LKIRCTGSCWSLPEAAGSNLDRHLREWFKSQINLLFPILLLSISSCASAQTGHYVACSQDPQKLEARSRELARIVKSDQDERADFQSKTPEEMQEMTKHDLSRCKRIGEIFGEGCFSKAQDFAAAALIYQHGDVPEHFFQTFLWAKRAVELGDHSQQRMMALEIDRFLVNVGKKQLFGSQATKDGTTPDDCWCLQQVEESFPDHLRKSQAGKNLSEALEWVQTLNAGKSCPIQQCTKELHSSPMGTVPGFW
jgi:hypothetical protein